MTKRTLNTHELEIVAGGAVEVSEDAPATSKSDSVMKDSSSGNSGAGGVDTENVQQNQDLPAA